MKRRGRRRYAALSTAVITALVFTSCADGSSGTAESSDTASTFIDVIGTNPPHLNPQLIADGAVIQPTSGIYEALVRVDALSNVHPWLAKSWNISPDGLQIAFDLQEGVEWHDGEPFTSHDVKFNLEEVLPLAANAAPLVTRLASVETPDELTVIVHLSEPFAPFVAGLAEQEMLPAHLYAGTDVATNPTNMEPVGTGPFMFSNFDNGDKIEVVKNEDYWGESGNLQRIIYKVMPDVNARILAMQTGEVDRLTSIYLDTSQLDTLREDPNLYFGDASSATFIPIFFNTSREALSDPRVRQALYLGIDRDAIGTNAYAGTASPATGLIPESVGWAYDPTIDFREEFPYDPTVAAAQLESAGVTANSDGNRLELDLHVPQGFAELLSTAQIIQSNLAEAGVVVNIVAEDFQLFIKNVYTDGNYDLAVFIGAVYEDPSLGVARQFDCNPTNATFANPTRACDAELQRLFAEAAAEADTDLRAQTFSTIQRRTAELLHGAPLVFLNSESAVRKDRWSGVEEFATYTHWDWAALSVKE